MAQDFRRFCQGVTLGVAIAVFAPGGHGAESLVLTAPDAHQQAQQGAITLIDIRTPQEWRQTGVAVGARRIDMRQPGGTEAFAAAVLTAVAGNKDAPIALICRTGNRTGYMRRELEARGFTQVYDVKEGMAGSVAGPGWIKRGLPLEACSQC